MAAARWRGTTGGQPLGIWAGLCAITWLWGWLLAPQEPLAALLPCFLAAAAFLPAVEHLATEHRPWLSRLEVPLVLSAHAALAVNIWSPVLGRGFTIHANDHWAILDHIETLVRALREGRWPAWSHMLQGGDSVGYLYPILLDLQTAIAFLLAPDGTRLVDVYGIVIVCWWALRGVAVYFLARRFAAPPIAAFFALAALLDVGGHIMDAGWWAAIGWGVFQSSVALTLAVFALTAHIDVVRGRMGARLVIATLLAALAGLAHPLGLLVIMLLAIGSMFGTLLARGQRVAGVWGTVSLVLALMLVAFYSMPSSYLLGEYGFRGGAAGNIVAEVGSGILNGVIPDSSFTGFNGFAAVAVLAAASTRQLPLLAATLCAFFLWIIEMTPIPIEAGLLRHAPGLMLGQARRVVGAVKLLAIAPMAWLAALAFAHLGRPRSTSVTAVLTRALVLFLVIWSFGRSMTSALFDITPQLQQQVLGATKPGPDQAAAFAWLAARRKEDPSPTLWRVAVLWQGPNNLHSIWVEGHRTGVPVVDYRWVSGNFLTFRPRERSLEGFRDWAIRYAMTDRPAMPVPGMKEAARIGPYIFWENPLYDGRSVVAPPGVSVQGLHYSGDRIRFEVKGAGAGAELLVRTAWFPRWRARQGGQEIPLYRKLPRPEARPKQDQIAVFARDGEVVLTCDKLPPRGLLGRVISLLGLGGLILIASARRRAGLEAACRAQLARIRQALGRVWRADPRHRRVIVAALVAVALLPAFGLWWRGRRDLLATSWPGLGVRVLMAQGDRLVPCRREFSRARIACDRDTIVNWWIGRTPVLDDSGEWPIYWPGTQIMTSAVGTDVRLRYPRVRLSPSGLHLKLFVVGASRVTVRAGGRVLLTRDYVHVDLEETIPVPPDLRGPTTVELAFETQRATTRIVFVARSK